MSSAEGEPLIRPEEIFPRCAMETMGGFAVMGLTWCGNVTHCTHITQDGRRCTLTTRIDEAGIHLEQDPDCPTDCLKFDLDEAPEAIARAVRANLDN